MTVEEVLSNIETGYRMLAKKEFICLLDAEVGGAYGGTGQAFDWELAEVSARFPVMVAGGLTPTNVGQLLKAVSPGESMFPRVWRRTARKTRPKSGPSSRR